MPFDIESARQAITSGQVKIKKGEGIAHALMRVADQENASKWVKELQEAFRKLRKEQKKDLMDLAIEVDENIPFQTRKKTEYRLHKEKYNITNHTQVDDVLKIKEDKPVETPKEDKPVLETNKEVVSTDFIGSTWIVQKNENDIQLADMIESVTSPFSLEKSKIEKSIPIPFLLSKKPDPELFNKKLNLIEWYLRTYNFIQDNKINGRYTRWNVAIEISNNNLPQAKGNKIVWDVLNSELTDSVKKHVETVQKILDAPWRMDLIDDYLKRYKFIQSDQWKYQRWNLIIDIGNLDPVGQGFSYEFKGQSVTRDEIFHLKNIHKIFDIPFDGD